MSTITFTLRESAIEGIGIQKKGFRGKHFATNFMKIRQFIRKLQRFEYSDRMNPNEALSPKRGCERMTSQPHYYKYQKKNHSNAE